MMVQAQGEMSEGSANPTDLHHIPTIIQPSTSQQQRLNNIGNLEERSLSLEKAATTTTSFDAEQDKGNIFKTQSKATPKKPGSQGTSLGGGPRCQEAMGDTVAQTRVLDLETTKTTQALKIDSLKRRVKKLERRKRSRNPGLKRLYKVRLSARVESYKDEGLDCDEVIVKDVEILFDVADDLRGKEVFVSQEVPLKESEKPKTTSASTRPKAKGLVIHKQEQAPTPIVSLQQSSHVNDKGKGKMVKPEPVKKLSKKDQEKAQQIKEVNIAWDDVQAKIDADYELAQRLQAEEQDELTDAETTKLFMQFLEKWRKFFATKRDEEKRDRPPTRAQQMSIIHKKVNTFVDFKTELVEESSKKAEAEITQKGSLKRAGDELEQERSKKQKAEDDKESEELKKCLEIIPDDGDDVTIDVTPLSSNKILKNFDKEDLEVLWRLVKARFEKVKPVDHVDSFLLHNLKTMFKHHVEDNNILYYLLVEKMYPLTNHKLHQMFNDVKFQVDYECEMAFERLRLVMKQLKEGYVPKRRHLCQQVFDVFKDEGRLPEAIRFTIILNGDSPTPTTVVDGVVQAVAPTTDEQRLAKKNKLKARGTLLMALPDKHQLKFNIHKDAKSLMEAIEKRRNKDDLEDQSLDGLFNNLKIFKAEVKSSSSTSHITQNIAFVSSQNIDGTNESVSVVPCVSATSTKPSASILPNIDNLSDTIIYSFFASQSNSPQLDNEDLKQIDANDLEEMDLNYDWSFQADEEPINYALMAFTSSSSLSSDNEVAPCLESVEARLVIYQQNKNVFEEDIKLLKLDVMLRDNDLVELTKKFEKAKKERDDLNHTLKKIRLLQKNLSKLLESQITDKTGLGYDNQVFDSIVFDYDELNSSESDVSVPTILVHDRYKSGEGYHVVSPPYTGTFMLPKLDLVFHDAFTVSETILTVFNVEPSTTKPNKDLSHSNRPSAPIIEDWVSDSEDESEGEPMPTEKAPSFVETYKHVKTTRTFVKPGNLQQALKDKRVIDSGYPRYMSRNISYLSDFKEINGGYVAFGGNPKGDKITGKDPIGKSDGKADEGFLVGYFVSSKAFRVFNSSTRIVQETLHINFLEKQPNVIGSGPTWLFDIDTLTHFMNYQPVVAGNQPNYSA
nr:ribonuclease H-like domain-containing protein [Tanacetum cinerariifolium]